MYDCAFVADSQHDEKNRNEHADQQADCKRLSDGRDESFHTCEYTVNGGKSQQDKINYINSLWKDTELDDGALERGGVG